MKKQLPKVLTVLATLLTFMMSAQVPTSSFVLSQSTVCLGQQISITDASTDSPDTWEYSIDETTVTVQNPVYTFTAAGSYTISLIASNSNGTGSTYSEIVQVEALPVIGVTGPPAVCAGTSVNPVLSGANSYTWTNGITTGTAFTPTASQVYTISGTDANGCVGETTYSLNVNALPALILSGNATVCVGAPLSLSITGADSYSWSTGGNGTFETFTTAVNTTVQVTGQNTLTGCTADQQLAVTAYSNPIITVNNGTVCAGQSFTFSPAGASSYTYSAGNVVAPSASATYTIIGADANGCVSSPVTSSITVNPLPVLSVNSGSICAGDNYTIAPSGAANYSVTGGNFVVSPSNNASYSVTGSSAAGCISAPVVVNLTVNPLPTVVVPSGSVCQGNSFTISPSGANSYSYSSGNAIVSPATTTVYTVVGTDNHGCQSAPVQMTLVVDASPVIAVSNGTICEGASFTLAPAGANTYSYSSNSAVVSPTATSVYSITGASAAGCLAMSAAMVTVYVNAAPQIAANDATICAGTLYTISPSGAAVYSISGGSFVVSPTTTATYTINGTDNNGCTALNSTSMTVYVNALPIISANDDMICAGDTATITPTGALSYSISGNAFVVNPTVTTSYSITGTDANGCTAQSPAIITITVNALPSITVAASSTAICTGNSATFTATGAFAYIWTNGAMQPTVVLTPTASIVLSVYGIDMLGCVGESSVALTVNDLPVVTVSASAIEICKDEPIVLTAGGAVNYNWNNGTSAAIQTVTPQQTTSFTVTGTDANGCSASAAISMTVNECTSVTEKQINAVQVYPNPGHNAFKIVVSDNATVLVTDITGRQITYQVVTAGENQIELSNEKAGVYFIQVIAASGSQTLRWINE